MKRVHETDSRRGPFNFEESSIPAEFGALIANTESVPFRRRIWEKQAMLDQIMTFANYKAHESDRLEQHAQSATARRKALEEKVAWSDPPVYLDGTPVDVFLKLFVKTLLNLDVHNRTVRLSMTVVLRWLDARVFNLWQECKTQSTFHVPPTLWRPGFDFAQGENSLFFIQPDCPADRDVYTMGEPCVAIVVFEGSFSSASLIQASTRVCCCSFRISTAAWRFSLTTSRHFPSTRRR